MTFGVSIKVSGPYACFTRPELKAERFTYDVMTPSAARGILEAIYWKPQIRWVIDRIHVLKPIRRQTIRRNELSHKMRSSNRNGYFIDEVENKKSIRQPRSTTMLVDVAYRIDAHFVARSSEEPPAKHFAIFGERLAKGRCFQQPYLGCREMPAFFEPATDGDRSPLQGEEHVGMMLFDFDFENGMQPMFYDAHSVDGVINVPKPGSREIMR